jgi:hypothetical protein
MKALLLSVAGLAGLAMSTAPALAHGPVRECRRERVAVRYRDCHDYRPCHRYRVRCRKHCRDRCYYESYRYCPPRWQR